MRTVKLVSCGPEVESGRCPNFSFFWCFSLGAMVTDIRKEMCEAREGQSFCCLVAEAARADNEALSCKSTRISRVGGIPWAI